MSYVRKVALKQAVKVDSGMLDKETAITGAGFQEFDRIDRKILDWFSRNNYSSIAAMAKDLDISAGSVRRHLGRLKKAGVVKMTIVAQPVKLGFPLIVLIRFVMERGTAEPAMQKLARFRCIRWMASITGRNDLLAYCWFRSAEELINFLEVDTRLFTGIKETEVFYCLQVVKGLYTQK